MADLKIMPTREKQRSDDLIEKLEYLLGLAKDGEIESVMAIAIRPNKNYVSVRSGVKDGLIVLGCLETLKFDLMQDMDAPAEAPPSANGS